MQDFHSLHVWQYSHQLVLDVYRISKNFPKEEVYGLTAQIRGAAASIPANIAEGCGRGGNGDMARFLTIAAGSALELEYHLLLARDLGYLTTEHFESLNRQVNQVKQLLAGFQRTIRKPTPLPEKRTTKNE